MNTINIKRGKVFLLCTTLPDLQTNQTIPKHHQHEKFYPVVKRSGKTLKSEFYEMYNYESRW